MGKGRGREKKRKRSGEDENREKVGEGGTQEKLFINSLFYQPAGKGKHWHFARVSAHCRPQGKIIPGKTVQKSHSSWI